MPPINVCLSKTKFFILSTFCLLQVLNISGNGEHLKVTYSRVRYPVDDQEHSSRPWYDGKDDIYIFGDSYSSILFQYSISKDTIHSVESLPVRVGRGSVHSDSDGNIFYFGADYSKDKVLKYSVTTNSTKVIASFPYNIYGIPTIKSDAKTVLILGRRCIWNSVPDCWNKFLDITSFDLTTFTTTNLEAKLPHNVQSGGAIKFGKDKVYLFSADNQTIREMDLEAMKFINVMTIDSLWFYKYPTLVTDGNFIFLFANYQDGRDTKGFHRIDPVSRTSDFVHVDNWPVFEEPPPCVYVSKLNTVYCFGCRSLVSGQESGSDSRKENDIFYFSLGMQWTWQDIIRQDIIRQINNFTFFIGEKDDGTTENFHGIITLLLVSGILVVLATGWGIRRCLKTRNVEGNTAVVWEAEREWNKKLW